MWASGEPMAGLGMEWLYRCEVQLPFVVFVTLMSKRQSAGPEGTILAAVNY